MSERITLTARDVAKGRYTVKFFFWITISPGSLGKPGNLCKKDIISPASARDIPAIINIFPVSCMPDGQELFEQLSLFFPGFDSQMSVGEPGCDAAPGRAFEVSGF